MSTRWSTSGPTPPSMIGRSQRDIYLHYRHGPVMERTDLLRDPETDRVRPEPCVVCGERLTTLGDAATHSVRHAQEGTMVPVISPPGLFVTFMTLAKWEERNEYNRLYRAAKAGHHPTKRVLPEGLDTETNLVRAKCMVCGNAAAMSGKHVDEEITDHESVIAYAPEED